MVDHISDIEYVLKSGYSDRIAEFLPFSEKPLLAKMADLFTPNSAYFYVVNLYDLRIEFISPAVTSLFNVSTKDITLKKLLELHSEEDLEILKLKEAVKQDFLCNFLQPSQRLHYKAIYTFQIIDGNNNLRLMLHTTSGLTLNEDGFIRHAFISNSDIGHLHPIHKNTISFISLTGEPSYLNVDVSSGKFDPRLSRERKQENTTAMLSKREKEIIKLLAKGLKAEEIANQLNLSYNTIRTHRYNMLNKTGSSNTTELVVKCLMDGLI
ncbi:response regulator transcription factor [Robertkochia solimangrovi]|uniref:response regulator transcription factor n=1 Tax=Robertkochia solimangrovi TaxID=2213046 RepID=UPI00117E8031|nr:LuxR C-terminal-related transcriptional regulator [Robertkochia solimangrovi]TRZ46168.1 hypothetical protein DMZ48_02610 [Robertkochia solimangrovi]